MTLAWSEGSEEGSRDFICWYLLTNHLDMNHSPPNGNPYSSSFPKALLWGCGWEAAFISSSYPLPHPCSLIKTPAYLKALHHPLTCIEFLVPHHWVYGASLRLLMTRHRVTHMNMEISHRVHILSYITGLNWIATVFFDWWCHPSAWRAFLNNVPSSLPLYVYLNPKTPKRQLWMARNSCRFFNSIRGADKEVNFMLQGIELKP